MLSSKLKVTGKRIYYVGTFFFFILCDAYCRQTPLCQYFMKQTFHVVAVSSYQDSIKSKSFLRSSHYHVIQTNLHLISSSTK